MKYRIILYLFLLGIVPSIYFIELESISYLPSRWLFWFSIFFFTSLVSTLFKVIRFAGKKVSLFSLLMLSTTEITGIVFFFISGIHNLIQEQLLSLIAGYTYIGGILILYTLIDESSDIYSNVFALLTSLIFNLIFFIIIFFILVYELHIYHEVAFGWFRM
jgi:hypothetical protein